MARRWLRLIAMIGTVHIAKSATSLGCWLRILAIIAPRNCVLASVYEVAVGVVGAARSTSSFRAIWPTSNGFVPLEAHVERQQRCLYEDDVYPGEKERMRNRTNATSIGV